jgi:histidinol-phosphatase
VERRLRAELERRLPDHAVLGEEDGLVGEADAPCWVIDPIDGTTNFVQGNPIWATLIGVRVDGEEVLGVASAPALGPLGRLRGPRRPPQRHPDPGQRGRVAVRRRGVLRRAELLRARRLPRLIADLATRTRRQRGYGDFWQHCLVASGSTDVALEAEVNLWDLSAVRAIVEAAGGRLTSLDGRATADGGSALSSNGRLHDEALALVREHHQA